MNETDTDPIFLHNQNYRDLAEYYVEHPIAIYSGAGVSWSDDPEFGVGLWDDFVRRILLSDQNSNPETNNDFEKKLSEWKDKPWEMAEWVANKVGHEAFQKYVMTLVRSEKNFQKEYKLLSGTFVKNARTLNAIVAFCAEFAGGKISMGKNGQWSAVYQRSINPRVHGVITSNYDPFLEAASSTMFRKPILKPVAAQGSSVGSLTEIPVFHIHGYVPFPEKFRNQESTLHIPIVDPVITTSDYKSAWKVDDAYNFTMGPQIHFLRHYTVLFIGFSFRDEWVNDLLRKLNEERERRKKEERREGKKKSKERAYRLYHYAIMREYEINAKGEKFFDELGVKAVPIKEFSQIKDLLSHLYKQALLHDYQGRTRIKLPLYEGKSKNIQDKPVGLSPEKYFEELFNCRLSMVWRNKSNALACSVRKVNQRKKNRNI